MPHCARAANARPVGPIPNSFRFAISSDEMNQATKMLREHLLGEQLSAITFVMDCLQFDFHGKRPTAFTKPKADIYNEDMPNFRDRLCAFITKEVTSVEEVSQGVTLVLYNCIGSEYDFQDILGHDHDDVRLAHGRPQGR
jgi:hypothetical protein